MQKLEQPREVKANMKLLEVPYDTNPDYERMPSRKDLTKDVEKIVKRRKNVPKKNCDLQKLINELVSQLKALEVANETNQTQNSEIEKNEKEIQTVRRCIIKPFNWETRYMWYKTFFIADY